MQTAIGIDYSCSALHVCYGAASCQPTIVKLRVEGVAANTRTASVYDRLAALLRRLDEMPDTLADPPMSLIVIERPFLGRNGRTPLTLAQITGAALATAHAIGWAALEEDPSRIRMKVIGQGSAKPGQKIKNVVKSWVQREYDLLLDENAADAVVIWRYAQSVLASGFSDSTAVAA